MTVYSKANLVVSQVASSDPFDRAMNGVLFDEDGGTVAGNGKVLMAVGPANEDVVHFPDVGERGSPGSGVVLEVDHVQEAMKNLPKDKRVSLQHTAMTVGQDASKTEFTCMTPSGRERRVADRPKQEKYPDWKGIVRKVADSGSDSEPVKVCVNRKDLIELLKALESACPDKGDDNPVFMEIGNGIVLRTQNKETGQHAVGAINAYNTRGQWMPRDGWERGIFENFDVVDTKRVRKKIKRKR